MNYESMIDPTEFGTVARYLANPSTGIHFVVHVKERSMLSGVAEKLAAASPHEKNALVDNGVQNLRDLMQDGNVLISAQAVLRPPYSEYEVPISLIPNTAVCYVIFAPPFYLTHTPGLSWELLIRPEPNNQREIISPPPRRPRMKL